MPFASLTHKAITKVATGLPASSAQSQQLIHTMLTMSFGCIAFTRGLFPDNSFADQRFVPNKFEEDYDPTDPDVKLNSLRVKTLVRGRSSHVDQFLDWIDEGILDALKRNYLKGLVLGIFLDESRPDDLHEAYSFSFDSNEDTVKLDMSTAGASETITLLSARQTLQHLMERLVKLTQALDKLPETKFVALRMLFSDDCPKDYQPSGFKDASDAPAATVRVKKPSLEGCSAGALNTGCHKYALETPQPLHIAL
ncbi:Hop1p [Cyberlindnera jadinii NRRL Y-1542]|uniref:DNA-binding protein n=1 Tax=Cyberlindnera jadinii (strain ATCC 18201 / CBS 1600 / BCRC 20928 / JCM 3617 / NBRC 0987 / NRRL Y-1542) TaxID=983966 RepID=A0A1E4S633_CYBJN|nr:DNA-binding protein [Cyberlindnera jadinii NRRL Y-1542]ODV74971.1 DNA-binding protein [Cyberlindnera jadinii NRRL Y-1542]